MSSMVLSVHCKADHSVEMLASSSEAQEHWDTVQQEPSGLPRHVDGVVAGSHGTVEHAAAPWELMAVEVDGVGLRKHSDYDGSFW